MVEETQEREYGPKEEERNNHASSAYSAAQFILSGLGMLFGLDSLKQQVREGVEAWDAGIAEANETGVEVPTSEELEARERLQPIFDEALAFSAE